MNITAQDGAQALLVEDAVEAAITTKIEVATMPLPIVFIIPGWRLRRQMGEIAN